MKFSAVENARLKNLHPDLVRVIRRAAEITPPSLRWRVMETARSKKQQAINLAKGVSKTMRSRHLPSKDGLARAADLVPIINGKPAWSWPPINLIAKVMFKAAKIEKVNVEWGGQWVSWRDGPHWQLPWREYP